MANENDVKTSAVAGLGGAESPTESPADVPVLYFDIGEFMQRPLPATRPVTLEPSRLYMMRCDRFVKVGISNDVQLRLRGLQGAVPFEVTLAKSYAFTDRRYAWIAEQTCHEVMADHRTYGEWFDIPYDLALAVAQHVVPATRKLMTVHRQLLRDERRVASERYANEPIYREKHDAAIARNMEWRRMDAARTKAMREAAETVERAFDI